MITLQEKEAIQRVVKDHPRKTISAERVATSAELTYHEALEMLRRLERQGMGRVVLGRRGQLTRFIWNTTPGDVLKHLSEMTVQDDDTTTELVAVALQLAEQAANLLAQSAALATAATVRSGGLVAA